MSPKEYKEKYLNLFVVEVQARNNPNSASRNFTSRTHRVHIRQYRNANDVTTDIEREKSKLTRFMRTHNYSRREIVGAARAFIGKASVDECNSALTAIVQSGYANRIGIQNYCDQYLGLDCSGFVGNYFSTEHGIDQYKDLGYIGAYLNRGRRKRMNFNDFRAKDVLIWCNKNGRPNSSNKSRHIAIINNIKSQTRKSAVVIESTGNVGLVHSDYIFTKISENGSENGVFKVFRGSKPQKTDEKDQHVVVVPVI